MDYSILVKCFLIGMLASSSVGPIFVLTFNRGAAFGFFKGFATALGACIADGLYFFLGLLGVLTILKESRHFMYILDTVGGILVIAFGIYSIRKSRRESLNVGVGASFSTTLMITKSFVLTILNPMVFLFFMVIGVQILPDGVSDLTLRQIFASSIMVVLGSLFVLSIVSFIATLLGKCMKEKQLRFIYFITGIVFIGVGLYFLDHLLISIFRAYR